MVATLLGLLFVTTSVFRYAGMIEGANVACCSVLCISRRALRKVLV